MDRKTLVVCLTALSASLAAVCVALAQPPQPQQPQQQQQQQQAQPEQPEVSPRDRARRSKVVAKIGDVRITIGDVEDQINAQSPFLRARYRDGDKLREFVQNMIRFELLAREAQKRGYGENEAVVRSVKQNAVQQLIRTEFDEQITPESIPVEDVRAYYEGHRDEFHRDEMVRASHILVADRAEAQRLIGELREGDARDFRQAAREHSIDTETKLRGGDLRYFTREGLGPNARDASVHEAIVEATFGLREVGAVVRQPVQVGEQWSVIKLTGRRPAEHRSFEDAEQGIRLRQWRERRQAAIERFVEELRQRHTPEIHEERMQPIRLDTTPEAPSASPHGEDPHAGTDLADPTAPPSPEGE